MRAVRAGRLLRRLLQLGTDDLCILIHCETLLPICELAMLNALRLA